jgi:hypothetical protein
VCCWRSQPRDTSEDDEALFNHLVRNLISAGFTDIDLYYPADPAQTCSFERVATEVIAEIRR